MKFMASITLVGMAGFLLAGCDQASPGPLGAPTVTAAKPANKVVVYYAHRTFRCMSCLWIEKTARQTLEESFSKELASGRVEFQVVDYWVDTELAKRYDVQTVSVIVVNVSEGREISHANLAKVWSLKGDTRAFQAYVADGVRVALAKTK